MDLYLYTGGRAKGEWFPESISGLCRASRSEIADDIEFIQANLPFSAAAAAAQAGLALGEDEALLDPELAEEALEGSIPASAAAAAAASASSSARIGSRRDKRKAGGGARVERAEVELEREVAASKRARLAAKIQQERYVSTMSACDTQLLQRCSLTCALCLRAFPLCSSQRLDTTKENGYQLRQALDALRAETQQYEDAIAQTKREMEIIQRETQM